MGDLRAFFKRKGGGDAGANEAPPKSAKTFAASSAGGLSGALNAVRWSAHHDSLLARHDPASAPCARVAAFDLDDTLQKTRSGRPGYAVTDLADFAPWSDAVAPALRAIHARGDKIVIYSNHAGSHGAMDRERAAVVRARIDAFAASVGVPMLAFCGTQKGPEKDPRGYRKPLPGMWEHFARECNGGVAPDLDRCFYVGDAAGRPGDHSDSDRAFARAVGVKFLTPEAFFESPDATTRGEDAGEKSETERRPDASAPTVVDLVEDEANRSGSVEPFDRESTP